MCQHEQQPGASIHGTDASQTMPCPQQGRFAFLGSQRWQPGGCSCLAGHAEKGSLAALAWQTLLGFSIISSLRLRGSEHKPVQSHCSRSPLAFGRVLTLPSSRCSRGRFAAPVQPTGGSRPFLQRVGTRLCLPQPGAALQPKHQQEPTACKKSVRVY